MENNQEQTAEKTLTPKEQKLAEKQELKAKKAEEKEKLAAEKAAAKEKAAKHKAKSKKENIFKKTGRKFKEMGSELKKVTWPNFKTVVKSTGVIIAVVLVFTVVLFGIETVLGLLFDLFTKNL